ncbi:MAG: hydroxylase [Nitrospina sp.]|nr:hydroxylase [Nitrospina sp.]MBT6717663.1 hydroxylase [Nitrospina sp.]
MKTIIDTDNAEVIVEENSESRRFSMGTAEAFDAVARAYLRVGWDNKYVYSFSWLGRPIIQLPDDMIRIQELIFKVKPDVVVEIGVAHGGSLIYYASIMKAMDKGRVIGVDVDIREHNRKAIEEHPMYDRISLIEGDSIAADTLGEVKSQISKGETVMVFLDGNHSKKHVFRELELYSSLIAQGSYILAMDGIQEDLVGAPRSQPDWRHNNAAAAARDFVKQNSDFEICEPGPQFNEGQVTKFVTYWPSAYIRRKS